MAALLLGAGYLVMVYTQSSKVISLASTQVKPPLPDPQTVDIPVPEGYVIGTNITNQNDPDYGKVWSG